MPILVSTINSQLKAALDDEGSDRYTFDQDFKWAINKAMDFLVTMLNQAFADNKLTPEALRELVYIGVWQANKYSRVSYSEAQTGHPLWTILAVYPKCTVNRGVSGITLNDKSESRFRKDLSFVSSEKSAKRLTFEEWNQNMDNAFVPGNNLLQGELSDYAYLDFGNYSSTTYTGNPGKIEIQIRPDIPGQLVAIAYLKYPQQVSSEGDFIEFPQSLTGLIVDLALNQISYKQNAGTTLFQITAQSVNNLVSLIR